MSVTLRSDFLALGGDSMAALRVCQRLAMRRGPGFLEEKHTPPLAEKFFFQVFKVCFALKGVYHWTCFQIRKKTSDAQLPEFLELHELFGCHLRGTEPLSLVHFGHRKGPVGADPMAGAFFIWPWFKTVLVDPVLREVNSPPRLEPILIGAPPMLGAILVVGLGLGCSLELRGFDPWPYAP